VGSGKFLGKLGKRRSEVEKEWEKLLHFVGLRPRSEKEVKDWLRRKRIEGKTAEELFNRLKRVRLVGDLEFSCWWIRQREEFRPRGRKMLVAELSAKGVAREVIEAALGKEGFGEMEGARRVVGKLEKRVEGRGKMEAALVRRGFSWETIKEVMRG